MTSLLQALWTPDTADDAEGLRWRAVKAMDVGEHQAAATLLERSLHVDRASAQAWSWAPARLGNLLPDGAQLGAATGGWRRLGSIARTRAATQTEVIKNG